MNCSSLSGCRLPMQSYSPGVMSSRMSVRRSSTPSWQKRKPPAVKVELPPRSSSVAFSSTSTLTPCSAADSAAHSAALPAPTTMTSHASSAAISHYSFDWLNLRPSGRAIDHMALKQPARAAEHRAVFGFPICHGGIDQDRARGVADADRTLGGGAEPVGNASRHPRCDCQADRSSDRYGAVRLTHRYHAHRNVHLVRRERAARN